MNLAKVVVEGVERQGVKAPSRGVFLRIRRRKHASLLVLAGNAIAWDMNEEGKLVRVPPEETATGFR